MLKKENRKKIFEQIKKESERKTLLNKVAQDADVNLAMDADDYADLVFSKILENIKIEGIDD